MTDAKTLFRTALVGASAVTALVPAENIKASWPTSTSTFPCITFNVLDNVAGDFYDNTNHSDVIQMEWHLFTTTSGHAIADACNTALTNAGWGRYFAYDFVESDGKLHYVMRFETTVFS